MTLGSEGTSEDDHTDHPQLGQCLHLRPDWSPWGRMGGGPLASPSLSSVSTLGQGPRWIVGRIRTINRKIDKLLVGYLYLIPYKEICERVPNF